jgi:GNAT superfamily N-acetyltransferase
MLSIRRYQSEDIEVVKALHYAGVRQIIAYTDTDFDLSGVEPGIDSDIDDIENIYLNNNGEFLIGIYEMNIVAIGALKKVSEKRCEIARMRVHLDYQRRGFGQTILRKLMNTAVKLWYTELCLDTLPQNIPARKMYEKNGFLCTGQKKIGPFDLVIYEKLLTP